ncbi:hypothetical protein R3P38DRAFT_2862676 [Favolaschia claudopus]|uniref:Fungal N-terminal domain-containing protein n=1 Tax=Favolaschia claudopus TaxID=2862362 RepID=A0AAW0DG23_9AGAR
MRLSSPLSGWRRPQFSTAKIKLKSPLLSRRPSASLLDPTLLSLHVLAESADAFPPLKSVVGGVRAICDIAQRARNFKSDAMEVALRCKDILDAIADAVPDGSVTSVSMLQSIERFTLLLHNIHSEMEEIARTNITSRLLRVARYERTMKQIHARLDNAYRDFAAAAALRIEAQQAQLTTQIIVHQDTLVQGALIPSVQRILFYTRLCFFGLPLNDPQSTDDTFPLVITV